MANVDTVDLYHARLRIEGAMKKCNSRRLPGTGGADEGDGLARHPLEVHLERRAQQARALQAQPGAQPGPPGLTGARPSGPYSRQLRAVPVGPVVSATAIRSP